MLSAKVNIHMFNVSKPLDYVDYIGVSTFTDEMIIISYDS